MAARIEVAEGPDKGWRFTLVGAEARIGRGAGHHVRVTDPAWPDGDVRVQLRHGGYLVTNGLPYPVYLDGAPLAPGDARALYHGAALQPTRATLLRLGVVDRPAGPVPESGVVAEPPPAPPRRPVRQYLAAAAAALLAGGYVFAGPGSGAAADLAAAGRHKLALAELEAGPPDPAREYQTSRPEVRAARLVLARAVYDEALGRRAAAHQGYRDARDRLTALRRAGGVRGEGRPKPAAKLTDGELARLAEVERFASDRLRATGRR